MENVEGKVVAVIGASSGIGRATAVALASAGAKLVLGARRTEKLDALAEEIEAAGGQAFYRPTDVCDRGSVQTLVDCACQTFGRLDVMVFRSFERPSPKEWRPWLSLLKP